MRHEDEDGHDVETTPLVQKYVSDGHQWNVYIVSPEERQSDQPNDEGWSREILKFFAAKMVAQISRTTFSTK